MRMPLHRQGRDDGLLTYNHRRWQQSGVGGFLNQGALAVKHKECHRTHSLDSPFDIHGTLLSNSLHQKACYELREASPELTALFAPIL